ncbi:MAG: PaaI family thioesterase [Actinomycetota bacterium]
MSGKDLAELERVVRASEFQRWAGLELMGLTEGTATFSFTPLPHHRNLVGGLHGGLLAILADTATGVAMHAELWPERTHVTVQLDLRFVARPQTDRIVATGHVVRAGRRIGFAEGEIADEAGTTVATASATFAISERKEQASLAGAD